MQNLPIVVTRKIGAFYLEKNVELEAEIELSGDNFSLNSQVFEKIGVAHNNFILGCHVASYVIYISTWNGSIFLF